VLVESGSYDRDFIERATVGFEDLAAYARDFTPDVVERETGVPAARLAEMARLLSAAGGRVALYPGNGLEHHENGVDNIRAIVSLNALLGTLGKAGGSLFAPPLPLRDLTLYDERPLTESVPLGAGRFPVLYEVRRECHTMTALDGILTGEPYRLRAMLLAGANPALTNPNSRKVVEALSALELLVVRDLFMTETAALADYVLPAASFLERSEVHVHHEIGVVTLTSRVARLPEVQTEYEFWRDLARRLGAAAYFPWEDERALNSWLLEPTGISLEQLEAHPEGVGYGSPPEDTEVGRFSTSSGKVELTSAHLAELGYDALPRYRRPVYLEAPDPEYPFVLMTGARSLLFGHSRSHNIPRFAEEAPAPGLEMHPEDAAALGLADGDTARVTTRIGSLEVPVRVVAANELLPRCLQLTHGWAGANANALTHDDRFDPISGFPLMKSVEARVEPAGGAG
jgi:anaerobic selenocysteine-containing dehydrogenase